MQFRESAMCVVVVVVIRIRWRRRSPRSTHDHLSSKDKVLFVIPSLIILFGPRPSPAAKTFGR